MKKIWQKRKPIRAYEKCHLLIKKATKKKILIIIIFKEINMEDDDKDHSNLPSDEKKLV